MGSGRIDIEVGADVSRFPADLEKGMKGAVGVATKIGGAIGAALGVSASMKAVLDLGNSFTNSINEMQAVSGATAAQLDAVREAAKGLGNDATIADTSATDAAAAMTELAKGGFSVDQSMSAARGTLQLAAAAQIEAAQAATIQSQALQAFGLDADYAAKAADVLANGANASSAEITDVAAGLQQAGAVANQFGVSLEDTVAGLGMLANAGIQGSDAGTLLKSALLALTDQGKPAQAAIEELGLTVYDAQGQFVGFRELFGQLQEASANMTPEMYQAATATLFGSDAMRLAGVAAEQGTVGWDAMRTAIEREGAAADVAAAKTQGLPGAIAGVQNSAEGLALELYDLVDGPLEGLATKFGDFISDATPKVVSGLTSVADVAGNVGSALAPAADLVGDLAGAFMDLPGPIQAVVAGFAAIKAFDLDDKIGGWVDNARSGLEGFLEQMDEVRQALAENMLEAENPEIDASTFEGSLDAVNGLLEENEEQISDVVAAWTTMEARSPAIARMGDAYRDVTRRTGDFATRQRDAAAATGGLVGTLRNAGASVATFGGHVGGLAAGAMSGLKSAAGGVISAFGGPWMVGLAAASMAVAGIVSEVQKASRQSDILESSSRSLADAQLDMAKAFQQSEGAISDDVLASLGVQIENVRNEAQQLAETAPGFWGAFVAAGKDIAAVFQGEWWSGTEAYDAQERMAKGAEAMEASFAALDLTSEQLAQQISGSETEFTKLTDALLATGEGGEDAVAKVRGLRDEFLEAQRSAKTLEPGFFDLAAATRTLADESASAEDKASALKRTLDVLAGVPIPLSDAIAEYNERVRETAEETTNAWEASQGWADALLNADGSINTQTANGGRLYDTLKDIRDATADAATAGADMAPIFANNEQQFAQLAAATGLTVDQVRAAAEALGLIPDVITKQVQIEGGDQAIQELNNVALAFRASDDLSIEFQVDDEAARANLESLGFTLENIPGTKNVQITAPNELALAALQEVIDRTVAVDAQSATPEINADTTGFVLGEGQVRDALADIDRTQVDPAVGAVIDDFLAGRDVTLAELARIDATKADPEVMLLIQRALADAQIISAEIDKAARKRDALIQVRAQWDPDARAAYFGSPTVQGPMPIGGNADGGRLPAYATGGRMPSTGPGTETTDGIYAVTPEGVPIAMVDGSEWVINSESSDKYDRELAMINAGIFPKLPGFETGGRIAADRAASFLRSESGKPYQYGGVGNPSWDCSGFVSAAYAQLKGLDPYTRWFTTESNFGALGFLAGLGGPSDLSIGVHNGGGGQYSHMAGTLDNTPFEAGSNGVRWGSGAAGANDPQFENRYHLPAAAFNPPGTGAMRLDRTITWSESDELKLDSARIAIRQAEEDRDRIHADPKKTQADRDQANNKVAQAEAKVRELEADKYKAETGDTGPAPQAPELTTTRTDDELRMRDLERAIDEANERRNEVYADPASTQNDRDAADDALQKARNALEEERNKPADKNEDGEGITASSIAELFGNVAKAAVQGQVEDAFGVIGFQGDGALSQAVLLGVEEATKKRDNDIPKVAPRFTEEELAKQGPVTPGTEGWLEELMKTLRVPAVLRDMGGPLPHGVAALNLSGEEEWVQTGEQRRQHQRDLQELAALRAERDATPRLDAMVSRLESTNNRMQQLVDNPPMQYKSEFHGYDLNEAFRRDRVERGLAAQTYLKRG
ncbi:phage tail tape measure protein [Rhodococcus pyridinivorans]|uniref:phage tail tape measure protein n=2 Tax=Nocardiaceae TaxID=85025 RepID=UPI001E5417F8|nr:phage tail tape measure protein [Rhodococcus pyridinivorans]UGQ59880.1 phage tail tape measure protein [Rhodococcus pyridinivorans]